MQCESWSDCSEQAFSKCCDLANAPYACIPGNWVDQIEEQTGEDLPCN